MIYEIVRELEPVRRIYKEVENALDRLRELSGLSMILL